MIQLAPITDVFSIVEMFPRIVTVVKHDNPQVNHVPLLQLIMACYLNGVVFKVRGDCGLIGLCAAEAIDFDTLELKLIPRNGKEDLAKLSMSALKEWALQHHFRFLVVHSHKFNGSNFKYFEHCLGFKREHVKFKQMLCQTEQQ